MNLSKIQKLNSKIYELVNQAIEDRNKFVQARVCTYTGLGNIFEITAKHQITCEHDNGHERYYIDGVLMIHIHPITVDKDYKVIQKMDYLPT